MSDVPHMEHHLFLHSRCQNGRSICFEEIQEDLQGKALDGNFAKKQYNCDFRHTDTLICETPGAERVKDPRILLKDPTVTAEPGFEI